MKLVNSTFDGLCKYIKRDNYKVVFFGAGAIGKVLIPYICNRYQIDDHVVAYIDNSETKQGESVRFCSKEVVIFPMAWLEENVDANTVLVITNSDFASSIEQLDRIKKLKDISCFIAPVMQLMNESEPGNISHISDEPLIPSVIHYCWFSGNPMPENLLSCIESWKEKCPDYELVRWDESNYDLSKYKYTKEAFDKEQWAFIPDLVRLDILYEYGGFYFDTDVRILRNLNELRYQEAFCGREEWGHVNFGGGSGCRKHFGLIKEILDFRKDEPFLKSNGRMNTEASGYYETTPLIQKGLHMENITETVSGMTVYSSEYFSPYNYGSGTEKITSNTFSIHYFNGGWIGEKGKLYRSQTRQKYADIVNSMSEL